MSANLDIGETHASCVCFDGHGVLILGAPGSGKSTTALACIALGARLVGDDRVSLSISDGTISVTGARAIAGLIEARGVGILRSDYVEKTTLTLIVDLNHAPDTRLPEIAHTQIAGLTYRTIFAKNVANLAIIIRQILTHGFHNSS